MPHDRCFKRICFSRCHACANPVPLWRRLKCFITYATYGTDPLPAEHMCGLIATTMGLVMLFRPSAIHASHCDVMFSLMPYYCWAVAFCWIGMSQLITPIFSMVKWVRFYRLWVAFSSGMLWTSIATITLFHLGVVPFICSSGVYAAASWWIFIRTPDAAPLRPAQGIE